jgi:methylphosphotriester-DNA--protein-cysteine methyltransferase
MFPITPAWPSEQLSGVIERYFITSAEIPGEQAWTQTALPAIMQAIVLNFTGTTPRLTCEKRGPMDPGNEALVIGQQTRRFTMHLEGKLDFVGVHFSPTGLYRLLQKPMKSFADNIQPLSHHVSWYGALKTALRAATETPDRIRILETFIWENLASPSPLVLAVEQAARLIRESNGSMSLEAVGRQSGFSERTMQRYFTEFIGVSPKTFARVARFNAVTKLLEQQNNMRWTDILNEAGYFDAAHFAHDFKRMTGQTPSSYYKGKTVYEKFFNGS